MNCRGHDKRVEIVNNYEVNCVAHIMLLAGQEIYSDAERIIENDYYVFICVHKMTGEKDKIICGGGAARDFFLLTHTSPPPIFNMLHILNPCTNLDLLNNRGASNKNIEKWDPAAKQLYNAIMILIVAWNLKPGPIYDYLEEAKTYKNYKPFLYRVERINKILHRNHTTMTKVIQKLREKNKNIKKYDFDLLSKILQDDGKESYF